MDSPSFDSHLQMALVERDHEVQTLAPEAAAEPLTYRVGPGRPVRSSKNSHSEVRHLPAPSLFRFSLEIEMHPFFGGGVGRLREEIQTKCPRLLLIRKHLGVCLK